MLCSTLAVLVPVVVRFCRLKIAFPAVRRYHTDPSGTFVKYEAKAIGSGSEGAQSSLQEHYNKVTPTCSGRLPFDENLISVYC